MENGQTQQRSRTVTFSLDLPDPCSADSQAFDSGATQVWEAEAYIPHMGYLTETFVTSELKFWVTITFLVVVDDM